MPCRIESIHGSVVDVGHDPGETLAIREALRVEGSDHLLEVQALLGPGLARALCLGSTRGFYRGQPVSSTGAALTFPVGDALLGRVVDCMGRPLDGLPAPDAQDRWPLHRRPPALHTHRPSIEPIWTGLKVIDLLCPFARGGKTGLFGGAGSARRSS